VVLGVKPLSSGVFVAGFPDLPGLVPLPPSVSAPLCVLSLANSSLVVVDLVNGVFISSSSGWRLCGVPQWGTLAVQGAQLQDATLVLLFAQSITLFDLATGSSQLVAFPVAFPHQLLGVVSTGTAQQLLVVSSTQLFRLTLTSQHIERLGPPQAPLYPLSDLIQRIVYLPDTLLLLGLTAPDGAPQALVLDLHNTRRAAHPLPMDPEKVRLSLLSMQFNTTAPSG
jgi:hypothetical protein